jgi:lipopolysaccharide transport system permease protein
MLEAVRQIARFRGLLLTLTTRDLKARYRGSVLGVLWSLINPLLLLGVYTVVFGFLFTPPRAQGIQPYSVFLVTGLFPWIWVSSSLLDGSMSLITNAGLIRKAVFPTEVLPMVSVTVNLAHLLLAVPIVLGALLVGRLLGYGVGGWGVLLAPAVVLLQVPLVSGLALGLAALNVHFKDVRDILANLLTLLFFMTPIIYALDAIPSPDLRRLLHLNPFTPFTLAYQKTLFRGEVPSVDLWAQMAVASLVAWAVGSWVFGRLRDTLVEAA